MFDLRLDFKSITKLFVVLALSPDDPLGKVSKPDIQGLVSTSFTINTISRYYLIVSVFE